MKELLATDWHGFVLVTDIHGIPCFRRSAAEAMGRAPVLDAETVPFIPQPSGGMRAVGTL